MTAPAPASDSARPRIAAVGDVHAGAVSTGEIRQQLAPAARDADVLLLAGDLTQRGEPAEAQVLADELRGIGIPIVAVLGNHDHHTDHEDEVAAIMRAAGIAVLEGSSTVVEIQGTRIGIVGAKGFGGGFEGACGTEFGERIMREFVATTRHAAAEIEASLEAVEADYRVLLLHYAPAESTLGSEPREIYPFLGSYLLGEAARHGRADLIVHGHAHRGVEEGVTPDGIPVRNVAHHVLDGRPYACYPVVTAVPASA